MIPGRPPRVAVALLVALVACDGGGPPPPSPAPSAASPAPAAQRYTCPMHPQIIRDAPGTCPVCGMDLVPVDAAAGDAGTVTIDPGVVQQIGVQTARVERRTVFRHLRTLGEVEVGEDELSVVNLRLSGWVEKLYVDRTGDAVRKGQVLFDVYSPELVAAQEEYLLAVRAQGAESELARSARRRMELWGLDPADIAAVAAAGVSRRAFPIRAPGAGFVLSKDVVEGGRVDAGTDLYRIGDLKRIWVTAEVYEYDAPWVEVGQHAQLELTFQHGEVLEGRVAYIYPTLNPESRTLTVRLEFDNPGVRLKPGMFATVYVEYRRKDAVLAIPGEAILYSGRRALVFVAHGGGKFEPREIAPGLVGDRRVTEVVSGLADGEEIAVSGQFLIDSESQLQEALRKFEGGAAAPAAPAPTVWSCPMHPEVLSAAAGACPQCGMDLVERPATPAELAKVHATAQPGQYTCPMHPEVVSDEPGRCPVCNMFLEQVPAAAPEPPR